MQRHLKLLSSSRIFRRVAVMPSLLITATVLLAQTTPPDKWEPAIQAFETADQTAPPPKDGLLFVGSSSIKLWKTLAEDFPGKPVINRGFGGSQIADSVRYADRLILPHRPRMVLLYAGDNDINAGKTPEQVLADFQAFTAKIHADLPKTRIAFIAIKPSIKRWKLIEEVKAANRLVREFTASDPRLVYIDIFTPMLGEDGQPRRELLAKDDLHLSEEGYRLWTSVVAPHLP